MPHVVIEYTRDLVPTPAPAELLAAIHREIVEVSGAPLSNIKSRMHPVDSHVGDGNPSNAMVHAEIALMEGRSEEAKQALATSCCALLRESFAEATSGRDVQVTVEVRDIVRATYAKHPPGTIADSSPGP